MSSRLRGQYLDEQYHCVQSAGETQPRIFLIVGKSVQTKTYHIPDKMFTIHTCCTSLKQNERAEDYQSKEQKRVQAMTTTEPMTTTQTMTQAVATRHYEPPKSAAHERPGF